MNTTKGPTRRGNRIGRPVYPPGTETRKICLTLSNIDYAIARQLGAGRVTRGVRRAIHIAQTVVGDNRE